MEESRQVVRSLGGYGGRWISLEEGMRQVCKSGGGKEAGGQV